ncbi:hypothetical protein ACSYAD_35340, partial [Acaryochloris marina NIES-2412]|uniref:hypothetical protein n=1 Tax=Acaryochloris marina TaxID=155978 RepID=UPI0040595971
SIGASSLIEVMSTDNFYNFINTSTKQFSTASRYRSCLFLSQATLTPGHPRFRQLAIGDIIRHLCPE